MCKWSELMIRIERFTMMNGDAVFYYLMSSQAQVNLGNFIRRYSAGKEDEHLKIRLRLERLIEVATARATDLFQSEY